ncbi:MAG: hypothetical protein IJO63_03470 [Bacilli bacterium]|nr:hypothetical protein [Bacilli bacterium]
MYDYGYSYGGSSLGSSIQGSVVWTAVALVLAIIGGIVVYFLFLKPNKKVENKFLSWIKDFLNFKKMLIEDILKVTYVILTIFITLFSFNFIGSSFLAFLLMITLGNVVVRVAYEASLMLIMIWRNTNDINKKMK